MDGTVLETLFLWHRELVLLVLDLLLCSLHALLIRPFGHKPLLGNSPVANLISEQWPGFESDLAPLLHALSVSLSLPA